MATRPVSRSTSTPIGPGRGYVAPESGKTHASGSGSTVRTAERTAEAKLAEGDVEGAKQIVSQLGTEPTSTQLREVSRATTTTVGSTELRTPVRTGRAEPSKIDPTSPYYQQPGKVYAYGKYYDQPTAPKPFTTPYQEPKGTAKDLAPQFKKGFTQPTWTKTKADPDAYWEGGGGEIKAAPEGYQPTFTRWQRVKQFVSQFPQSLSVKKVSAEAKGEKAFKWSAGVGTFPIYTAAEFGLSPYVSKYTRKEAVEGLTTFEKAKKIGLQIAPIFSETGVRIGQSYLKLGAAKYGPLKVKSTTTSIEKAAKGQPKGTKIYKDVSSIEVKPVYGDPAYVQAKGYTKTTKLKPFELIKKPTKAAPLETKVKIKGATKFESTAKLRVIGEESIDVKYSPSGTAGKYGKPKITPVYTKGITIPEKTTSVLGTDVRTPWAGSRLQYFTESYKKGTEIFKSVFRAKSPAFKPPKPFKPKPGQKPRVYIQQPRLGEVKGEEFAIKTTETGRLTGFKTWSRIKVTERFGLIKGRGMTWVKSLKPKGKVGVAKPKPVADKYTVSKGGDIVRDEPIIIKLKDTILPKQRPVRVEKDFGISFDVVKPTGAAPGVKVAPVTPKTPVQQAAGVIARPRLIQVAEYDVQTWPIQSATLMKREVLWGLKTGRGEVGLPKITTFIQDQRLKEQVVSLPGKPKPPITGLAMPKPTQELYPKPIAITAKVSILGRAVSPKRATPSIPSFYPPVTKQKQKVEPVPIVDTAVSQIGKIKTPSKARAVPPGLVTPFAPTKTTFPRFPFAFPPLPGIGGGGAEAPSLGKVGFVSGKTMYTPTLGGLLSPPVVGKAPSPGTLFPGFQIRPVFVKKKKRRKKK